MEIIVGKTAGFCFGVQNAVNQTLELVKNNKDIYCLGEIVHNKQVNDELKQKGVTFIDSIKQANKNVIIRAHGEPKQTYEEAKKLKLNVTDLTCPKVITIHQIAEEYAKKGYYIFLIGKKTHPETVGTISFCGDYSNIIESKLDIEDAISALCDSGYKNLLIIVQTTFSVEKFNQIVENIKDQLKNKTIKVKIKNTICSATSERQKETKKISKQVDLMIIVGGKHSSNTNKLFEIAKENCRKCNLIEDENELDTKKISKDDKIGIMAGASTPIETVREVIKKIQIEL